jgi:hypothetical protein
MPLNDYKLWLHGKAAPTTGVNISHSGDEYSEDEINFGVTNPNVGAVGNFGLHIEITEAFATMSVATVSVVHGASTAPTTILVSRYFALADLTLGKHYFLPMPPTNLQFVRAYWDTTTNASTGMVNLWLGPGKDGCE